MLTRQKDDSEDVQRAGIVKHAYYDDPDVNYLFYKCTFESVGLKGIAGGSSAGTGISPAQEPVGHEIVRGVKVENCVFVTRSGDAVKCSVEPGRHADQWEIKGNRFILDGSGFSSVGALITISGEGTVGYFIGGGHLCSGNWITGGGFSDTIIASNTSVKVEGNFISGGQFLRVHYQAQNLDGEYSEFTGNRVLGSLMGGGASSLGGVVDSKVDKVLISGNNIKVALVENTLAPTRTTARIFAYYVTANTTTVSDNQIMVYRDDSAITALYVISPTGADAKSNRVDVHNSVGGGVIYGLHSTAVPTFVDGNTFSLTDTSTGGAATKTAVSTANDTLLGVNKYSGWTTNEEVLP